ncbi:2-oxo-4-hydroxy-4-carboxy-5-ureidoimidazoline decarboxylase [Pantoea sp. B550]|uniref:2-oxo-4-hydroxy-4-carboxy-5-ureidoimidazoline decarboxylase n=1 Tax=unclassified Pantoea TaxID=2630326 RepID=UPI001377F492|nr:MULTISPECIES: 2-oxo-4-hydroxy-4-carboxy-5-ureidoimidazoline decarboxylase [Pantoea]MCP1207022.1 2-oxo-4-hydroxy-4-carboxy-5-ureidoimidazoline decarboxylase [Pantoea sp. B550]MCT2416254.1 2-oxo-4-hydroxy-4-carboxy-5-ureidoimidazoline decarboxylase [Pantoea sp. XY16]NBB55500.1 2-oxo-4-hydroxy-4-carboxy-5-ureidoimidazoline decarboxylase [Pantoea vagans]
MELAAFNQLSADEAQAAIRHCVALPHWQQALVAARPFATTDALLATADALARQWQQPELEAALSAHPRIGERANGADKEAALSRGEQSAMQQADHALQQAMQQGNQAYEARFGRVFLIRARGRSGEQMLAELQRRLQNSEVTEQQEALDQLREITLLRLKETMQ